MMKKYLLLALGLLIATPVLAATVALPVFQGGTGASTFGQGWLHTNGSNNAFTASTSPTVNYIYATSTTATNYFAGLLKIATTTSGCATFSGTGLLFSTGVACGTGSGSGGSGSISTSTAGVISSLLYYSTAGATPELVAPVATTTLTASSPLSLSNPVAKVGGVNSVLSINTSGTWSGNAGTATALAANGTNCSAGNYPLGVDASGNVESCTALTASQWTTSGNNIYYTTGNVGIGTTSPYAALSVVGSTGIVADHFVATSTSNTGTTTIAGSLTAGTGAFKVDYATGSTSITNLVTGPLTLDVDAGVVNGLDLPVANATNGTVEAYYLNIDASSTPNIAIWSLANGSGGITNQRVGIATTTPGWTFSVDGKIGFNPSSVTTNTGAATYSLCLDTKGEVTKNSDNETCIASSERFKKDIVTLPPVLDKVLKLRPVSFEYKDLAGEKYGLIAEEAQKVDPLLASTDSEGLPNGIRWSHITTFLISSIQEIILKITGLEARMNELEARIKELESK